MVGKRVQFDDEIWEAIQAVMRDGGSNCSQSRLALPMGQIVRCFYYFFMSSSSSGTKPRPPHVGHWRSSSVSLSTTPSPLQSGQVFMRVPFERTRESNPARRQRPLTMIIFKQRF